MITMRFIFFFVLFQIPLSASFFGEQCPGREYNNMIIFWMDYNSFYIRQEENGSLSGTFPRIMSKSLNQCCPSLNYSFEKLDHESTSKHEADAVNAIEKDNRTVCMLFPTLAAANDFTTLSFFKFIPIKVSPGPMVLGSKKSLENDMDPKYILFVWNNPVVYLILSMTASAGVIFWFLVRIFI